MYSNNVPRGTLSGAASDLLAGRLPDDAEPRCLKQISCLRQPDESDFAEMYKVNFIELVCRMASSHLKQAPVFIYTRFLYIHNLF